ncbi:Programmed cell death toxin YdcE [Staphylococcus aureus]|uniref:Programmed cell death toxin YdcE n=1 Tax=Staphylococcus aureus TaxID=1280 RepID=A0A380ELY7_STAAU|nr:Programmed cell death toxin YdcE [Staphylococcus aureus]
MKEVDNALMISLGLNAVAHQKIRRLLYVFFRDK